MPLSRLILKTLLLRQNRRHLMQGRPRLVGFAFDHITAKLHIDGRFEDEDLTALERFVFPKLKPGGVCLDIGANIGNHAVAFAPHFAHVHAFEPNPNVCAVLQINAKLRDNITVHNLGLSDSEALVDVIENPINTGGSGLGRSSALGGETVQFKVVPLDSLSLDLPAPISFVKIDVEGHEAPALSGGVKLLSKHRPVIGMEISRHTVADGKNPALQVLKDLGYAHFYELPKPRGLRRIGNRMPSGLQKVDQLDRRNYPIFIAAYDPLD